MKKTLLKRLKSKKSEHTTCVSVQVVKGQFASLSKLVNFFSLQTFLKSIEHEIVRMIERFGDFSTRVLRTTRFGY